MIEVTKGEPAFIEGHSYSELVLTKAIVISVGKKFCEVKYANGNTQKFNLENGHDTGRKYGRCNLGDTRYELLKNTPDVMERYQKQIRRKVCINAAHTLNQLSFAKMTDDEIDAWYAVLSPVVAYLKQSGMMKTWVR